MSVAESGATFVGETLRWETADRVLTVTLDRAPLNEIGRQSLAELEALAAHLRAGAGGAQALILTSARPGGFSAGADLRALYAGIVAARAEGWDAARVHDEVRGFLDRIHAVFDTLDQCPLTTIAATHGVCFGGGFELALTCDVLIADKSTRFCFPELRLGLIPGWGGIPRLRRDVGNAVVRDLLLTGRSLNATRAQALGLVGHLVNRGEALPAAVRMAQQACRFDAGTQAAAKAFLKPLPREALDREKALFCQLFDRPEVERALRGFVERTDVRPYLP